MKGSGGSIRKEKETARPPFLVIMENAALPLFLHILVTALQGNGAFFRCFGVTGAGLFDGEFESADFTYKQISFLHVTAICHCLTPFH